MSGITGIVNWEEDISDHKEIIKMTEALKKHAQDEESYFTGQHINLGSRQSNRIASLPCQKQPISAMYHGNTYTIVYHGELYNTKEMIKELIEAGYTFESKSDIEVILKSYIAFGPEMIKKLNGVFGFAIWDTNKQELYLARDRFGVKPLFYTMCHTTLLFSTEIKALLAYPEVIPILDKESIEELFGIGPAHTPGHSVWKNMKELEPGHYAIYNKEGLHIQQYWKLKSKEHKEDLARTSETIKQLLEDAISMQLSSPQSICTFLSGGLDSSIITSYANTVFKGNLHTFSVDYLDNDKNFVKSDFQPNSDNYYIQLMTQKLTTKHHSIIIDTPELAESLEEAMEAREMPGMADVDSSLLLFCKKVKEQGFDIAVSGECADEIFAGYPWFFREDALNSNTFPWSIALSERQKLLHPDIASKVDLKEYVDYRYQQSLSKVEILDSDSRETAEKRKIAYLTQNWFMQTLLDRSDRMALYSGLNIRVPFCDYRIVEYLWNVPWELKALNGREKGLLRYVVKDILPSEIVDRKKSPYPKTHNPTYLAKVKEILTKILENKESPITQLLNKEYILEILQTNGTAFTRPWFGQLMTGPQLMAYLCQVNMWLEKYQPKIEL